MVLLKPALADLLDFAMPSCRGLVLAFKAVKAREYSCNPRPLHFPKHRKEIVFFIRGVFRCGVAKVLEGRIERMAVFRVQRAAFHLHCHFQQCLQEPLDAAMTVRQQSESGWRKCFRSFQSKRALLFLLSHEMLRIDLCEVSPLIGKIVHSKYCRERANGHTRSAINIVDRMDVELGRLFKAHFILLGMNAIDRARIDTSGVLHADARLSNNIGHGNSGF